MDFHFPVSVTKREGVAESFALEDPAERRRYFHAKVGREIEFLRDFLRQNTFVGILLGPKNSGKGTYIKLFMEAVGAERIAHISLGDVVRSAHKELADASRAPGLVAFLKSRYRGFLAVDKAVDAIMSRGTAALLPTEVVLALIEREISKMEKKAVLIDGFPRNLDQVSYSLYFRNIIGYRDDPDFLVFIDVPMAVINERIKDRVVCPVCQTPRGLKLSRTKEIGYDETAKEFYLICDDAACGGARMVPKEGDALGVGPILERIQDDWRVMEKLLELQGVPRVCLRNSLPVSEAEKVDQYEITPAYHYEWDEAARRVNVMERQWIVPDDSGADSYSLLPAAVAVSFISQTARLLGMEA